MNSHLNPQQMLAYLDGELSKSEMHQAQDHLHSCWTCRSQVERLKSDIATILDAQNESFSPALPPPPRPWASFETMLALSFPAQPVSLWARMTAYIARQSGESLCVLHRYRFSDVDLFDLSLETSLREGSVAADTDRGRQANRHHERPGD